MGKKAATKRSKNKPQKEEILKSTVDEIIDRRTFEPWSKPVVGCRFLRLNKPGEKAIGRLGFPIKNFRQCTSYPLRLDSGEIIELVGNKLLHKQIREGDLSGQRVEIEYQGREATRYGHYRKIYRVFKIGYGDMLSKKDWQEIIRIAKEKETENGKGKQ